MASIGEVKTQLGSGLERMDDAALEMDDTKDAITDLDSGIVEARTMLNSLVVLVKGLKKQTEEDAMGGLDGAMVTYNQSACLIKGALGSDTDESIVGSVYAGYEGIRSRAALAGQALRDMVKDLDTALAGLETVNGALGGARRDANQSAEYVTQAQTEHGNLAEAIKDYAGGL